jgi:hypothetical protein
MESSERKTLKARMGETAMRKFSGIFGGAITGILATSSHCHRSIAVGPAA